MTFPVRATQCESCIFRPHNRSMLPALLAQVRDPHVPWYFKGFRECHEPKRASGLCCRGFWDRYRDRFTVGQLAQRLGMVIFTDQPQKRRRR